MEHTLPIINILNDWKIFALPHQKKLIEAYENEIHQWKMKEKLDDRRISSPQNQSANRGTS